MRRVLLAWLLVAAPAFAAPDPAVRALVEAGHWKQARALLEPRVKSNPSDAEAAVLLARVRLAFGDADAALPLAETAVKLEPKVADYHWQLAKILLQVVQHASVLRQMGLSKRFRQEADAAIALDANQIDARRGAIPYYVNAPGIAGGDTKKAEALVEEVARIDPASGFLARAQFLTETKAAGDLESLYRQAADAARTPAVKFEATVALLNVCLNAKPPKYEAAEQHARNLLKLDPHRVGGHTGLVFVFANTNRLTELDAALADAEKAVPDNLAPYFQAGRLLLVANTELPRAERYLRKYLTIESEAGAPTAAVAHWRLGQVLEKEGRKADAIAEIEQAVKLRPDLEDAKKDLKRLR